MDPNVLQASARALGLDSWGRHDVLTGGRGQAVVVWRQDQSYVLKAYDPDKPSAGVREKAALRALRGASGTPRPVAEGNTPPWVLMSRLEGSGSLADLLQGSAPDLARTALMSWADVLASVHDAGTPRVRKAFQLALEERAPQVPARSLPHEFADAAARYPHLLQELGLPRHEEALHELSELPSRLSGDEWEVLSPADTCPDNNLLTPHGMHLLDFEFAELRHAAWDVAYLRVPWASCWCAWRLPDVVAEEAVARYCAARGEAALSAEFGSAIDLATLGWQLMTPAFFIAGALTSDDSDRPGRPGRRAFVLHRLDQAAKTPCSRDLAALARDLHGALRDRWRGVQLELAPAFRS